MGSGWAWGLEAACGCGLAGAWDPGLGPGASSWSLEPLEPLELARAARAMPMGLGAHRPVSVPRYVPFAKKIASAGSPLPPVAPLSWVS
jgi:hypothetical protein